MFGAETPGGKRLEKLRVEARPPQPGGTSDCDVKFCMPLRLLPGAIGVPPGPGVPPDPTTGGGIAGTAAPGPT